MNRSLVTLATIAFLAGSIPAAFAGQYNTPATDKSWISNGEYEPNHPSDTATWMWQERPNCLPSNTPAHCDQRVYFNVYNKVTGDVNPNVATTGSRVQHGGGLEAHFGVWRDCNGDGYIGMANGALQEYRSQLLDAAGLQRCPSEQGTALATTGNHNNQWGHHNANGWVTELVYIAGHPRVDGSSNSNPHSTEFYDMRTYHDNGAFIWGDVGTPGGTVFNAGASGCAGLALAIRSNPEGSTHTTGGILSLADCSLGGVPSAGWNFALRTVNRPETNPLILNEAGNWNQAGHPLNQQTFGDDHSDESFAHVSDCTKKPVVAFYDLNGDGTRGNDPIDFTTTEGLDDSGIHQPAPSVNTAKFTSGDWTIAGQVNATKEESPADSCEYAGDGYYDNSDGEGDVYDDEGHDAYILENEIVSSGGNRGKVRTDMIFRFWPGSQGRGTPTAGNFPAGNNGAPQDNGLEPGHTLTQNGPAYSPTSGGAVGQESLLPRASLPRVSATSSTPVTITGQEGVYFGGTAEYTFYAKLTGVVDGKKTVRVSNMGNQGQGTTKQILTPSSSVGQYGSEWCDTNSDWTTNGGFNCDGNVWWTQANGEPVAHCEPGVPCELQFPRPNSALGEYHFKDTDCFDNSISGSQRGLGGISPVSAGGLTVGSDGLCSYRAPKL